jgi:hypothetical protein
MSAPVIWNGTRSKLLTALGLKMSSGQTIDYGPEINVILTPNDVGAGATTGANGPTAANSTSSSDLPLEGVVNNCIKMTSATAAGAEATHYWSLPITMPAGLQNCKHKIDFWMRPGSNFLSGEWTVSVYSGSTRMALSTDSSGATTLPNQTGKFSTTFDADTSSSYTLRFSRPTNAGTNAAILNVAGIVVGPGIQPQGANVGKRVTFTPTEDSGATWGTLYGYYVRIGECAHVSVFGACTSGTGSGGTAWNITLPAELVIAAADYVGCEAGVFNSTSGVNESVPLKVIGLGTNVINVGDSGGYRATIFKSDIASATNLKIRSIHIDAVVPISAWAGSGTVNVAQNDVEYAYNTTTTDAADTTAFGYGPAGNTIPSVTADRLKRVRFLTPIQSTDRLTIEVSNNGGPWVEIDKSAYRSRIGALQYQNAKTYGIGFDTVSGGVSSTDIDVAFGQYASNSGTTFDSAGTAWSSFTAYKWRVRKVSGGQAIGFGNVAQATSGLVKSAGQLLGTNTNDAAATGYVGELLSQSRLRSAATALTTATAANVTSTALTLTAGDWDISAILGITPAATTSVTKIEIAISQTSATLPGTDTFAVPSSGGEIRLQDITAAFVVNDDWTTSIPKVRVSLAATTTFYLVAQAAFTLSTLSAYGYIAARRVR